MLTDPEHASIRLVVNPERMVIRETQRTYTYLNLYDYATDAILVNRRLSPTRSTDPFFEHLERSARRENIEFVREAFGSLPMLKAPLFGEEVGGLEMLRRLADELYGDRNPAERMFDGVVHKLEQLDGDSKLDAARAHRLRPKGTARSLPLPRRDHIERGALPAEHRPARTELQAPGNHQRQIRKRSSSISASRNRRRRLATLPPIATV